MIHIEGIGYGVDANGQWHCGTTTPSPSPWRHTLEVCSSLDGSRVERGTIPLCPININKNETINLRIHRFRRFTVLAICIPYVGFSRSLCAVSKPKNANLSRPIAFAFDFAWIESLSIFVPTPIHRLPLP